MRLRLLLTIMISCCFLSVGCSPDRSDAQVTAKDELLPIAVPNIPRPEVVLSDPSELPPALGGGSQGAIKPGRTGNPDEPKDRTPPAPPAVCGNGIQEVKGKFAGCPFDIYGTAYDQEDRRSFLAGFNVNAGGQAAETQRIDYALLGCNVEDITAIEFAPDGTLYGVGTLNCSQTITTKLFTIDCATAEATLVGDTQIENLFTGMNPDTPIITDLDFDPSGKLYAYVRALGTSNPDELGTINIATGLYTTIGSTGVTEMGSGLASLEFPDSNSLSQAGTNLRFLNPANGLPNTTISIDFPGLTDPRIRGMDRDPINDKTYVNLQVGGDELNPAESYLAILNLANPASVNYLRPANPILAPADLRGITVNLTYEVCDGGGADQPEGTTCSESCELVEDLCDDFEQAPPYSFIDNDFDGLPNCEDPDCLDKACNDKNACTEGDTCQASICTEDGCISQPSVECVGQVPSSKCEDNNQCTLDTCVPLNAPFFTEFACQYSLSGTAFGSCTPDVNEPCLAGRCNINVVSGVSNFVCEAVDRQLVPVGNGGCDGGNECLSYDCVANGLGFNCNSQPNTGTVCDGGNPCASGVCDGAGNCSNLEQAPNFCDSNDDCPGSSQCVSSRCSCDDGNVCTLNERCSLGVCGINPIVGCQNNSDCGPTGTCTNGRCVCLVVGDCPAGTDICGVGVCVVNSVTAPPQTPCQGSDSNCYIDQCDGSPLCVSTPDNLACGTNNLCLDPLCTEAGCDNEVLDGPISCEIVIGQSCTLGTIDCNNGTESMDGCEALVPTTACPTR